MKNHSNLVSVNEEQAIRTSVHLVIIVNNTTRHMVRPGSRNHAGRRFFCLEVLDVGVLIGSIRSNHLLQLIDFGDMSADHLKSVDQSAPWILLRLTTWMYRTPEMIEWLTLKVIRTLILRGRSA